MSGRYESNASYNGAPYGSHQPQFYGASQPGQSLPSQGNKPQPQETVIVQTYPRNAQQERKDDYRKPKY